MKNLYRISISKSRKFWWGGECYRLLAGLLRGSRGDSLKKILKVT